MVRNIRRVIVVLAVVLLGFALAGPATAISSASPTGSPTVSPSPSPSETIPTTGCADDTDYPVPCLFSVQVAPTCVENVPEVSYDVLGAPAGVTTVDLTFDNPSGPNATLTGLPLHGIFANPAAFVKAGILIHFLAGPGIEATAAYPAPQVDCGATQQTPSPTPTPTSTPTPQVLVDTPSPTATPVSEVLADDGAVLSATGSNGAPILAAAIGFVLIGAAAVTFVTISRRRRNA